MIPDNVVSLLVDWKWGIGLTLGWLMLSLVPFTMAMIQSQNDTTPESTLNNWLGVFHVLFSPWLVLAPPIWLAVIAGGSAGCCLLIPYILVMFYPLSAVFYHLWGMYWEKIDGQWNLLVPEMPESKD